MCPLTPELTTVLTTGLGAPAEARSLVDACACHRHHSGSVAALTLIVSELVTNAVLHGCPPICLRLRCDEATGLEAVVGDGDQAPPRLLAPPPDALGGRGMELVDLLSLSWGSVPTTGGKTVWSRVGAR